MSYSSFAYAPETQPWLRTSVSCGDLGTMPTFAAAETLGGVWRSESHRQIVFRSPFPDVQVPNTTAFEFCIARNVEKYGTRLG